MTSSSLLWLIARRDLLTRARSRAFQVSTGILVVAVVVGLVLGWVLSGEDEPTEATIGLTEAAAPFAEPLDADTDELVTTIASSATVDDLQDGTIDVLFDGSAITWEAGPWPLLDDHLRSVIGELAVLNNAAAAGLSPTELGALFTIEEPEEVRLDGSEEASGVGLLAAMVAAAATTFLIQIWGSFLTMGVVEEKASRIVEILLAQVPPTTLMSGKILGIGLLAFLQLLIVVGGLVGGLLLTEAIDIPAEVWGAMPLLVATFVLGFGFYATLFAAAGATVSRQEDATTAQLPVLVPLMTAWFVVVSSLAAPDSIPMTVASIVPFTSPIAMPARYALGAMPVWQVAVSLALLLITAVLMIRVAASIYRSSLLRTGARVSLREAWQNRRQAEI
jgi:ABC-2 type transport system permease protein